MARARSRPSPLHCCTRWEECRAHRAPLQVGVSSALLPGQAGRLSNHGKQPWNEQKAADPAGLAGLVTVLLIGGAMHRYPIDGRMLLTFNELVLSTPAMQLCR